MRQAIPSSRRRFLKAGVATAAGVVLPAWTYGKAAPAIIQSDSERPVPRKACRSATRGDGAVVVMEPLRSRRPACWSNWSYDERFRKRDGCAARTRSSRATSPLATPRRGSARRERIFVRARFQSLNQRSRAERARLRQLPRRAVPPRPRRSRRALRVVRRHGRPGLGHRPRLRRHEDLRSDAARAAAIFFIHSGDTIYADGPLQERVTDANGKLIWTNAFLDACPRN